MAGSGGLKRAAPRQAKADEQKEGPPQGRLVLLGAENCRLQVERSEIELTPELVKITTPVFRELGFQKGGHSTELPAPPERKMTLMEKIHLALDGLGFMPLFGSAFDGINAVIYVGEGKYGAAMLSGASVIPIVGLSAKVTKLGLKGTKYAQEALKLGGSSVDAAKTAEKLAADAVDAAKLAQEAITSHLV